METWLRQNNKAPEYKLSAATVQGLKRTRALHEALDKMREGEKKVYQRFLQSQKMRYNANMGSPAQRQLFGSDRRMTNQDLAEAAMQAPASLAGLSMISSLGLPGLNPVQPSRVAPAPGAVNPIPAWVLEHLEDAPRTPEAWKRPKSAASSAASTPMSAGTPAPRTAKRSAPGTAGGTAAPGTAGSAGTVRRRMTKKGPAPGTARSAPGTARSAPGTASSYAGVNPGTPAPGQPKRV